MCEEERDGTYTIRLPKSVAEIVQKKAASEEVGTERWIEYVLVRLADGFRGGTSGLVSSGAPNDEASERQVHGSVRDRLVSLLNAVAMSIQARTGLKVTVKPCYGRVFSLAAGKVFSWAHLKTRGRDPKEPHIEFVVNREWADKAGVEADKNVPGKVFTFESSEWYLMVTDTQNSANFTRVVDALSSVCIKRQQLGR